MKVKNVRRRQARAYFRYIDSLARGQPFVLVPWSVVYRLNPYRSRSGHMRSVWLDWRRRWDDDEV